MTLVEARDQGSIGRCPPMGNPDHYQANWGHGYSSVLAQFVPKLRRAGVKETTYPVMLLVDNPRRFLAFVPKSS